MDSLGARKAFISKYTHSKMDEYKKQVKIDAIKAAQAKAEYLMNAIGSRAGKPVSVTENSGYVVVDEDRRAFRGNTFTSYPQMNSAYESGGSSEDNLNPLGNKTIKISYEINVEFEIL